VASARRLLHFVHTPLFEKVAPDVPFTDEDLDALQKILLKNPEAGDLVQGAGGVRKVRVPVPARGKGTSGGARVIYYYVSRRATVYLLYVFSKGDWTDISADGKKVFKELTAKLDTETDGSATTSHRGTI
jgi:hypothetical protein